jgi:hypothetical protein
MATSKRNQRAQAAQPDIKLRRELKGSLRIGFPTGGGCDSRYVSIEVMDDASGSQVFEVQVGYEEFTTALSRSQCECKFWMQGVWFAGYIREHKTEYIERRDGDPWEKDKRRKTFIERCAPLEVDGWRAEIDSALRTQQNSRDHFHIGFCRYIDPDTGLPTWPNQPAATPEEPSHA